MSMMKFGKMHKAGDIVLSYMQFADAFELKKRPGVVLFSEYDNIVIAGITSNLNMKGISLSKSDGMLVDSIIKLNYIFTVSQSMIVKKLFSLSSSKKKMVFDGLVDKLSVFN